MRYHGADSSVNQWDVFWYEKNLQGDVVAVYNEAGTKLISYTYDAFGQTMSMQYNGGYSTAAYNNPFRYRGYYYDRDIELYYLNSRYYDSYTGRFISADNALYHSILGYINIVETYNKAKDCIEEGIVCVKTWIDYGIDYVKERVSWLKEKTSRK